MVLSGVQFLLLLYLFISDLAEQPVPLFELDKNHVLSVIKEADGVCPFVISPSFLLEDLEPTKIVPDYVNDGFRKLSFIDSGLNFSFINGKIQRYFTENFGSSFEQFVQKFREQLSFSHFFEIIFNPANAELSQNRMVIVQLWVLYVFVALSVFSLWNYKDKGLSQKRQMVSTFGRTRFLICVYAIGRPSSNFKMTGSADAQDTALFFIWSVTIGVNYFMSLLFYEWLLQYRNRNCFNYRLFRVAYIIYLIGVVIFASTLLSYVVLPKSRFILPIYSIMLVSDALQLIMTSCAEVMRSLISDPNNEIGRFGVTVLCCSADLFESIFIGSAIYHGLFARRRLISIALCSYNSFVINRLFTLDYPEFRSTRI